MASVARFANVVGKILGSHWQILKWYKVEIEIPCNKEPWDRSWKRFLLSSESLADEFERKARAKYPDRRIYNQPVYVLTANSGKTAMVLEGLFWAPKRSSMVPDIPDYRK